MYISLVTPNSLFLFLITESNNSVFLTLLYRDLCPQIYSPTLLRVYVHVLFLQIIFYQSCPISLVNLWLPVVSSIARQEERKQVM
jgi:hypothetical protein